MKRRNRAQNTSEEDDELKVNLREINKLVMLYEYYNFPQIHKRSFFHFRRN